MFVLSKKIQKFFWVNTNKALFDIYKSFFQKKKKREEYFFIVLCGGKIKPNYKKRKKKNYELVKIFTL